MHVEDRRVRAEVAVAEQLRVEPVLEDARDQRPVHIEDRLPVDHRGEAQDLVEGHATVRRDGEPAADRLLEAVEHVADELVGGGVRQDVVGRRPQEALERGALRQDLLQPRVVREKLRCRVLGQLVEVLRVHRELIDCLELRGDLLEPKPRPQADLDGMDLVRRQQRCHQVVRRHRPSQDERPGLERAGQPALRGDEDEGPAVLQEALGLEPVRDRRGGLAAGDLERDLGGIGRGRGGQLRAEVLAHEVGDEGHAERRRVARRPAQDRVAHQRPEDGDERRQDDRREDHGEDQELQEAGDAAATTLRLPGKDVGAARGARRASRAVRLGIVARLPVFVGCPPVGGVGLRLVAGASAGADRHSAFSVRGSRASARASSSSWRMIAAASRSTRDRQASRCARVGGPPERPRFIGPTRSSAR